MMLVEVDIDEQKPEIQKVEVMNIDKVFEYTEKSIQDNIRKSTTYLPFYSVT